MPCKRKKTETKILRNAAQTKNLSNKLLSNPQDSTETQGKLLLEHMNEQEKKPVTNIKNISAFFRYNFLQLFFFHFIMQADSTRNQNSTYPSSTKHATSQQDRKQKNEADQQKMKVNSKNNDRKKETKCRKLFCNFTQPRLFISSSKPDSGNQTTSCLTLKLQTNKQQ